MTSLRLTRLGRALALLVASLAATCVLDSGRVCAQGVMDMEQDGSDERAKAHFRVGRSLYDSGRFSEAAEEWEKAYALSGRPELLYNIYVAHRDASETPKAIDALRRYLESGDVEAVRRVNLEARLRAMEESQRSGEPVAPAPVSEPEPAVVEPEPEPAVYATSATSEQTSSDDEMMNEVLPYSLIGVGGALVVGAVVTGLITNSKSSSIESDCPDERCPPGYDLDSKRDTVNTLALVTDVLWIGGALAAGAGITLLVLASDDDAGNAASRAGAQASVGCVPGACAASVRGRF